MSTGKPPPGSIPTLTEVVAWPTVAPSPPAPVSAPAPVAAPIPVSALTAAAPQPLAARAESPAAIDEDELAQRVLADIQKQVDLMLEVRLREALAPALARATDALVRDARKELTSALRDVVAKSVTRELARRGHR